MVGPMVFTESQGPYKSPDIDGIQLRVTLDVDRQIYIGTATATAREMMKVRDSMQGTKAVLEGMTRMAEDEAWSAWDIERHVKPLAEPLR